MTSAHTSNTSTSERRTAELSTEAVAERARALYRYAGPSVDTATAARLRAARQAALDVAERPHRALRWMMPAGAFAVAALAVVVVWQPLHHAPQPVLAAPTAAVNVNAADSDTELPPDADSADPALYQDLDFYAWLAQQPADSQPKGG